jgi:hypothetical protein
MRWPAGTTRFFPPDGIPRCTGDINVAVTSADGSLTIPEVEDRGRPDRKMVTILNRKPATPSHGIQ